MRELMLGTRCVSLIQAKHFQWSFSRYYASKVSSKANYYDVLGVKRTSSQKEIKAAFFSQSKKVHPDTNVNDPTQHEKFVQLNEAYSILSKPKSRREYDQKFSPSPSSSQQYQYTGGSSRARPGGFYDASAGPPPGTPFGGPDPFSPNQGFHRPSGPQRPFSPEEFYKAHYAENDREAAAADFDPKKMKKHFATTSFFLVLFLFQLISLNWYIKVRAKQLQEERKKRDKYRVDDA